MDDYVRDKLFQWRLSDWIYKFKDQEIDTESFYCLEDEDIKDLIPKVGPRVRFKRRLKLLKQQKQNEGTDFLSSEEHEELSCLTGPSPSTRNLGKRKLDTEFESSKEQPAAKQYRGAVQFSAEEMFLCEVKKIMVQTHSKLLHQDNKLNSFLKNKIIDLSKDKREMVGVFGRTGAGKSSLINTVIGKTNLLPSGDLHACTSVMIKVEANIENKYEADIEFITKEEWRDELWSTLQCHPHNEDQETNDEKVDDGDDGDEEDDDDDDDDDDDYKKKLSALYGEDWQLKNLDQFMDPRNFKEIPEFLQSRTKILKYESAEMLSEGIAKYTKNVLNQTEGKELKRLYWPLVKCVTVKVPKAPLLQHVTLVDLPGNGDRNKSRDKMWKGIVGKCSTVWIVADITRVAGEKESWEILKRAASLLGNGGECQYIHFICTKTDLFEDFRAHSEEDRLALIQKRNENAKEKVKNKFKNLDNVKKHFSEDCFEVFTVSSKAFMSGVLKENSEIPKLQKCLQDLNQCHSETLNYVSGAYGILSLIQGTRDQRDMAGLKEVVYKELEENKSSQLELIKKEMEKIYSVFDKCLSEGVEKSKSSWGNILDKFLNPRKKANRGFHRTLKCLVQNGGIHKPKNKSEINLNMKLTAPLTNSIDEEFRKTFPNKGIKGPFNGVINKFSLNTEKMKAKYSDLELQLTFLMTEEEKVRSELNSMIRDRKKTVYSSLIKTVEESMQKCYKEAAKCEKDGALRKMKETIKNSVTELNNTMFEEAKRVVLTELKSLVDDILETVESTMEESLELSLKTEEHHIPDVSTQLEMVKKIYDELKSNAKDENL